MIPYAYLLWLWLTFFQPSYVQPLPTQPTYQAVPAQAVNQVGPTAAPLTITMPPCKQLGPTLNVCP